MKTLAIKGTVTNLEGPIADQLNALGKELLDCYMIVGHIRAHIDRGHAQLGLEKLHGLFSYWLDRQEEFDPLNHDSIDPDSEDINTHMLFTQFMRIEQQIAIYYQAVFKMLAENGLESEARKLPMPPCVFPDDAGPDNWEYWTEEELLAV